MKKPQYPPAKNILTLDLSFSNTGWAAKTEFGSQESGKQEFRTPKGKSPAYRFFLFNQWLDEMLKLQLPDLVVYEEPHLQGRGATHALVGLATRVEEACAKRGIRCLSVHTGKLKKHATGKGNATKSEMKEAASQKWSWYDATEDEGGDVADANHLCDYAILIFGEEIKP